MTSIVARLFMLGLVLAMTTAFAPLAAPARRGGSALQMKFLKDLGLEKPSWLPDFGGEKEKEEVAPSEGDEDAEAATEEEASKEE